MFARFLRRVRRDDAIAQTVYGAIVAEARRPEFYAGMGVPDTVDGRFELIVLHLVLLLRRLQPEGEAGSKMGQAVFDAFVEDMDRSLREMGVGDLGIPRRMKQMAQSFYGRLKTYGEALAARDRAALTAALTRNLHPGDSYPPPAEALAGFALAAGEALARQSFDLIRRGDIRFPAPAGAEEQRIAEGAA
jgi:cytochrome b pre-mRNA-processing protein 3